MKNHEKPTWSFTGWLQVVWGDSKEEVIIFRYRTFLLYIDHQPLIKNLSKLMVGLVAVRLDHRVLVRVEVRPDKIIWQQWGKMVTDKNFLSLLVNLFVDQRRRRRRFLSVGWWQYMDDDTMMTIQWWQYNDNNTMMTILSMFTSMTRHCSRCGGWHKVTLGPSWSKAGREEIQIQSSYKI